MKNVFLAVVMLCIAANIAILYNGYAASNHAYNAGVAAAPPNVIAIGLAGQKGASNSTAVTTTVAPTTTIPAKKPPKSTTTSTSSSSSTSSSTTTIQQKGAAAERANVTFYETGLPANATWTVKLGAASAEGLAPQAVEFSLVNGTYTFFVGYSVANDIVFSPLPISENITVNGSTSYVIHFAPSNSTESTTSSVSTTTSTSTATTTILPKADFMGRANVTFYETGLPTNATWGVQLGDASAQSIAPSQVGFSVLNGTYEFMVSYSEADNIVFAPLPLRENITVNGSTSYVIHFASPQGTQTSATSSTTTISTTTSTASTTIIFPVNATNQTDVRSMLYYLTDGHFLNSTLQFNASDAIGQPELNYSISQLSNSGITVNHVQLSVPYGTMTQGSGYARPGSAFSYIVYKNSYEDILPTDAQGIKSGTLIKSNATMDVFSYANITAYTVSVAKAVPQLSINVEGVNVSTPNSAYTIHVPILHGQESYTVSPSINAGLLGGNIARFSFEVKEGQATVVSRALNTSSVSGTLGTFNVPSGENLSITFDMEGNSNYSSVDPTIVLVPTVILEDVPITITNNQNVGVNSPFQVQIGVNALAYEQYETNALTNAEFFYANSTIVPSWMVGNVENGAQTTNLFTSNTVWYFVKVPGNFLPADSSNLIYLGWTGNVFTPANTLLNAMTTGEAPQLSSAFGQYDDGHSVFEWYDNGITTANFNVVNPGGITVSNEVGPFGSNVPLITLAGSGADGTDVETVAWNNTAINGDNIIVEGWIDNPTITDGTPPSQQANACLAYRGTSNSANENYIYCKGWSGAQTSLYFIDGATQTDIASTGTRAVGWVWASTYISGTTLSMNESATINGTITSQESSTDTNIGSANQFIGIANWAGSTGSSWFYTMDARARPPNGVIPSVTFGPVNTAGTSTFVENGLPTGTTWNVMSGGITLYNSIAPSNRISFYGNTGQVSFTVPNQTISGNSYVANVPTSNTFIAPNTVDIQFNGIVYFVESGLPGGVPWSMSYGGSTLSSITNTISFNGFSGSRASFTVPNTTAAGLAYVPLLSTAQPAYSGSAYAPNTVDIYFCPWLNSEPASLPSGVSFYAPITLCNPTALATPIPFQQEVNVNSLAYNKYETGNLMNVEFFYANGIIIPSWLEGNNLATESTGTSNSATSTLYWLNLAGGIPSVSNSLVYMGFGSMTTNFFSMAANVGEAPQLSTKYAQYDDGANVFSFYDNFKGTTLGPAWTVAKSSGGSVSVNNGVTFTTATSGDDAFIVSTAQTKPLVSEAYMATGAAVNPIIGESTSVSLNNFVAPFNGYSFDEISNLAELDSESSSGGTQVLSSALSSVHFGTWQLTWAAVGQEYSGDGVTSLAGTDSSISPISNYRAYVGQTNYAVGSNLVQWVRMRAVPPDDAMPYVIFNSVATPPPPVLTFSNTNSITYGATDLITANSLPSTDPVEITISGGQFGSSDVVAGPSTSPVTYNFPVASVGAYTVNAVDTVTLQTNTIVLSVAQATPEITLPSFPYNNTCAGTVTANIVTINNQLSASDYVNGTLITSFTTQNTFFEDVPNAYTFVASTSGDANYISASVTNTFLIPPPGIIPTNVLDYACVSLQNSQASGIQNGFQQMVPVNSLLYKSYESGNLMNVEFFYENGSIVNSWLEGNVLNELQTTSMNTIANTIYWLNITGSFLPAGTSNVLYIGFGNTVNTNYLAINPYTGEAPQLSTPYAEYDDGNSVFLFYSNFTGTALAGPWSTTAGSAGGGTGSATEANGLVIDTSTTHSEGVTAASTSSDGYWFEVLANTITSSANKNSGPEESASGTFGTSGYDTGYGVGFTTATALDTLRFSGAGALTRAALATSSQPGVIGVLWNKTGNEVYNNGYVYTTATDATDASTGTVNLDIVVAESASVTYDAEFQWARTRYMPPNDVMPSVTFGPLIKSPGPRLTFVAGTNIVYGTTDLITANSLPSTDAIEIVMSGGQFGSSDVVAGPATSPISYDLPIVAAGTYTVNAFDTAEHLSTISTLVVNKAIPALTLPNFPSNSTCAGTATANIVTINNQVTANDFVNGVRITSFTTQNTVFENGQNTYVVLANTLGNANYIAANIASTFTIPAPYALPSGISAYSCITLQNGQSGNVPAQFQQMVPVNSLSYGAYETNTLDNVEFFFLNGTTVPSWMEGNVLKESQAANQANSVNTIYWLSLPEEFLPIQTTNIVYMGFGNWIDHTNYFAATANVGEAPQLSPIYGQYDDGANVFSFYDNFSGTTLSSQWSATHGGTPTITVDNGLTLGATLANSGGIVSASSSQSPQWFETLVTTSTSSVDKQEGPEESTSSTFGTKGYDSGYGIGFSVATAVNTLLYSATGALTATPLGKSAEPNVIGIDWNATGNEVYNNGYTFTVAAGASITQASSDFYSIVASETASATATATFQWARARAQPPNDVMPSAIFDPVILVPNYCEPYPNPNTINFGALYEGNTVATGTLITDLDLGNANANIIVEGSNWISGSNSFLAGNTLWNPTSAGAGVGNALSLYPTVTDTHIVTFPAAANNIYYGLKIPYIQPGVYSQNIVMEDSC